MDASWKHITSLLSVNEKGGFTFNASVLGKADQR